MKPDRVIRRAVGVFGEVRDFYGGFVDSRLGMRELRSSKLSIPLGSLGRSGQGYSWLTIAMPRM